MRGILIGAIAASLSVIGAAEAQDGGPSAERLELLMPLAELGERGLIGDYLSLAKYGEVQGRLFNFGIDSLYAGFLGPNFDRNPLETTHVVAASVLSPVGQIGGRPLFARASVGGAPSEGDDYAGAYYRGDIGLLYQATDHLFLGASVFYEKASVDIDGIGVSISSEPIGVRTDALAMLSDSWSLYGRLEYSRGTDTLTGLAPIDLEADFGRLYGEVVLSTIIDDQTISWLPDNVLFRPEAAFVYDRVRTEAPGGGPADTLEYATFGLGVIGGATFGKWTPYFEVRADTPIINTYNTVYDGNFTGALGLGVSYEVLPGNAVNLSYGASRRSDGRRETSGFTLTFDVSF